MVREHTPAPLPSPIGPVLGIDFGTSNSAAALVDGHGRLHTITLEGARASMPTALYFSSEDGHLSFGTRAMQDYLFDVQEGHGAGRLMRAIKSLLGSALINEQTVVNGQAMSFFEVVVLFFREIKQRAEAQMDYPVRAAMLGRPVHFVDDNPERDALAQATLLRAAHAAGFERVASRWSRLPPLLILSAAFRSIPKCWWLTLAGAPQTLPSSSCAPDSQAPMTAVATFWPPPAST